MTPELWIAAYPFLALIVVYLVNLGLLAYKQSQEEIDALTFLAQADDLVDAEMERRA